MRLNVLGVTAVALTCVVIVVLVDHTHYDVWSAALTFVCLVLITAPLLAYLARIDGDRKIYLILLVALVIKLLMSLARYYMANVLYSGSGDAGIYHAGGVAFASNFRAGNFEVYLGEYLKSRPDETRRIATLTGITYLVSGPSIYSGYFVHSWFGFLGNLAVFRAFKRGVPEGDSRRYLYAVMFLPSLMFWPSGIGKDGWMVLCLGLVTYGAARLLGPVSSPIGIVSVAAGVAGAMWIRPHMGLIAGLSLAVGFMFMVVGRRDQAGAAAGSSSKRVAVRAGALVVVSVLVLVAAAQVSTMFGGQSTGSSLQETLEQTQVGGSAFEATPVRSPLDLPMATLSVLFRPFIWEAGNLNNLVAAAEGFIVLGLLVANRRRLAMVFKVAWKRPYVVYCLAYTFAFIVAFSNIANAAILVRQRSQLMGLFLTFIAMPLAGEWSGRGNSDSGDDEPAVDEAAVAPVPPSDSDRDWSAIAVRDLDPLAGLPEPLDGSTQSVG